MTPDDVFAMLRRMTGAEESDHKGSFSIDFHSENALRESTAFFLLCFSFALYECVLLVFRRFAFGGDVDLFSNIM